MANRKKIEYGTPIQVKLTQHDRQLILEHTFCDPELEKPLRVAEVGGKHILVKYTLDDIDELLGYPTTDPHGSPIPTKDGVIDKHEYDCLADLQPGQFAIIRRVPASDPDVLRYLADMGLTPDTEVAVLKKEPFNGPIMISIGDVEHHVGHQVASSVLVTHLDTEEEGH